MHACDGDLRWVAQPSPSPGPGEVGIRVLAAGVNRADLIQRAGHYPPPAGASPILGLEVSGTIDAIGPGVERWQLNDPVCALLSGGGYAEQVVCPQGQVLPIPAGVNPVHAAALPEVFATAWLNLFELGGLQAGQRALIHAGASGVGTAALQLCRLFEVHSFVTVGSPEKLARCEALGASGGVDRHAGPWVEAVRTWSGRGGVQLILDCVGGDYLADDLRCLGTDGVVVLIGLLAGRHAQLDLGRLLVKRLRLLGSTLRALPSSRKAALCHALEAQVWPAFGSVLQPVVAQVLPVQAATEAHALLASNQVVGKLVLQVRQAAATQ